MKMRLQLIVLLFCLLPGFSWALSPESAAGMLEFLKGDGAFEKWFMEVFTTLDAQVEEHALAASLLGRTIGGLGALIYLGYLGFQMQEGARPWEVTPMLRPIIIGFILLNWVGFTQMIQYPLEKLAEPSKDIFFSIEREANRVRIQRFEKQSQLLEFLIRHEAEEKAREREMQMAEGSGLGEGLLQGVSTLLVPVEEWMLRMDFQFQKLLAELLEALSLTVLRVCTYLIFFIQKIWSYILIVLGPIAVGLSLIPGFEHSFSSWVSKFININLYTFISYTVINIGQQLIISGYHLEIERYDALLESGTVTDLGLLSQYITNNGMIHTVLFPCVAYLVTGIGILLTPSIADSIVSAGGAGLMSKGKAGANKMFSLSGLKALSKIRPGPK